MEVIRRKLFCPFCTNFWFYDIKVKNLNTKENRRLKCHHCNKTFYLLRNHVKIYLSRTDIATDIIHKYRVMVEKKYSGILKLVDPLNIPVPIQKKLKRLTVQECKIALMGSDIIVANMAIPTPQVFFEIALAARLKKAVLIISEQYTSDPWLKYFSSHYIIFEEYEPCFDKILTTITKRKVKA